MSVTVQIENREAVLAAVRHAAGPVTSAERKAIGAEVARLLRRHLRQRDDTHGHTYPAGGRRSHFWRKAAEAVSFAADADAVTVSVSHLGVRLRYAGAPDGIRPVNAKALAIPAHPHAYGRLPREFPDLRLVVFKGKGKAALVQKPKDGEQLGAVMFWLVKQTKPVKPDATVLPPAHVTLGVAASRLSAMRRRKAAPDV